MAVGLLQRKGVLLLSQGRERRNQGHGSKLEGRPLGGWPACLGPGSPGEGLSTGPGGGHSLLRFRVRPAPPPSPAGPLWQLHTMDARVHGHSRGLCAFFPEAPAGRCWEGKGPA